MSMESVPLNSTGYREKAVSSTSENHRYVSGSSHTLFCQTHWFGRQEGKHRSSPLFPSLSYLIAQIGQDLGRDGPGFGSPPCLTGSYKKD